MTMAAQMNTNIVTRAIRVESKSSDVGQLDLCCMDVALETDPFTAIVEIVSAGVNPSDVKAVLGGMPHAVWPRTPGRDYAGVVVEGPQQLLGREVWGSGGDLGIRRDGTHARYLVLPAAKLPH